MKIVFDTNVLISSTLWNNSVAQKFLFRCIKENISIFSSQEIIEEYKKILARDFNYKEQASQGIWLLALISNNMKNKKKAAKRVSGTSSKPSRHGVSPLGDRVLIKEVKDVMTETKSGIIIPETVSDDKGAKRGKVIAVGEGHYADGKLIPIRVKVGDTVLYQWGDDLKIDGEEYTLVNESSVLAVIK